MTVIYNNVDDDHCRNMVVTFTAPTADCDCVIDEVDLYLSSPDMPYINFSVAAHLGSFNPTFGPITDIIAMQHPFYNRYSYQYTLYDGDGTITSIQTDFELYGNELVIDMACVDVTCESGEILTQCVEIEPLCW